MAMTGDRPSCHPYPKELPVSSRLSSSTTKAIIDAILKDPRIEAVHVEPSHADGTTRLRITPAIKDRRGTHRITSVMHHALKGTSVTLENIEGPRPVRKKTYEKRGFKELRFSHYDRDYWMVSLKDAAQERIPARIFDPFNPQHTRRRA